MKVCFGFFCIERLLFVNETMYREETELSLFIPFGKTKVSYYVEIKQEK